MLRVMYNGILGDTVVEVDLSLRTYRTYKNDTLVAVAERCTVETLFNYVMSSYVRGAQLEYLYRGESIHWGNIGELIDRYQDEIMGWGLYRGLNEEMELQQANVYASNK